METFKILHRTTGELLFELRCTSLKVALKAAVKAHTNLQGADLQEADLQGAYLGGANLQGANLQEATLQGAYLERANLQEVNLFGAFLQRTSLEEVNLQGANLFRASLLCADLQGANLRETNLEETILQGSYLQGSDLWGAKFLGVNFLGVDLSDAKNIFTVGPCDGYVMFANRHHNGIHIYADCRGPFTEAEARAHWNGRQSERARHDALMIAGVDALVTLAKIHEQDK